jgi:molecular chaperone IbpA
MRTLDFGPLYRSTVGFDRLVNLLDRAGQLEGQAGYPPYNIERTDDHAYRITMAVAGFGEDDLTIEVVENALKVSGRIREADESEGREFLHRGIAERAFERRFQLADHVEVKGASLENGLLSIDLKREVPERLKPRQIEISRAGSQAKQIGHSEAA